MKMVYLSPVPWLSISQRPHFFVQQALAQGIEKILWVDPYPGRFPHLLDFIPGRHTAEPFGLDMLLGLQVISIKPIIPIEPLGCVFDFINYLVISSTIQRVKFFCNDEPCTLVVGKPSRLALALINRIKWNRVWFDAMDNYPAFYSGLSKASMRYLEKEIAGKSNKIICSSHPLAEKFSSYGTVDVILNARAEYIVAKKQSYRMDDGFVYIGTIAGWMDWVWLTNLADSNKDKIIAMYGPVKTSIPKLPANIIFHGAIPHHEINDILSCYSAAIIPFVNNEITKYVDPVKFYEYNAAGLDVISTVFGEMQWHYEDFKSRGLPCKADTTSNLLFFYGASGTVIDDWSSRLNRVFNDF